MNLYIFVCVLQNKIQELASLDKLRYLHRLLSFLLPVLKQIHSEQCFELELEARVNGEFGCPFCFSLFCWISCLCIGSQPCSTHVITGVKADIPRAKISADEQMCW